MKRYQIFIRSLILFFLFISGTAWGFWGRDYLVEINGQKYTTDDFKRWWKYWKDPGMKVPETPDPFIDWNLMADEALALGLDQEPSYRRKLDIFIQVRSLMQLKYDEVDSRIDLSRKTLWPEYVKNYTPRLKIKALITNDENEVQAWKEKIKTPKDFETLFEKLSPEGKARDFGWERPITIPEVIKDKVLSASPGEILGPLKLNNRFYILYVEEKRGPEEEDFKKVRNNVATRVKKRESQRLTAELIKRLREKYPVEINQEVLNQIGLEEPPKDLAGATVLKIADKSLTGADLHKLLKKEAKLRAGKTPSSQELNQIKQRIINDSIAQTLTTWEAINRHYEKRPPLKEVYDFYRRQRLVRELEEKIIWPNVKVTEEDARRYYEEHKKDFTRPAQVEMAVIKTQDEQLARKVYQRIQRGEDFFEVAKEVDFHGARPERRPLESLVPEMREVLEKMEEGRISPIIKFKSPFGEEWYAIVKLLKKNPEEVHPFEMVKKNIMKTLAQRRFEELKREYLAKLREKSQIKIHQKTWRRLKKELEATDEAHVH